ncbi:Small GTPase superfamily [Artemisia annua]|uniref:Small GTPase superfamily n=1 Tax=Artemisia annua TaxID=35608 RepID=A0A2U1QM53_ARTAN|nr:Small GTPase superfamily [Artemisia annua]
MAVVSPLAEYKLVFWGINQSVKQAIGIDFFSKTMYLEDRTVRLQLWVLYIEVVHDKCACLDDKNETTPIERELVLQNSLAMGIGNKDKVLREETGNNVSKKTKQSQNQKQQKKQFKRRTILIQKKMHGLLTVGFSEDDFDKDI